MHIDAVSRCFEFQVNGIILDVSEWSCRHQQRTHLLANFERAACIQTAPTQYDTNFPVDKNRLFLITSFALLGHRAVFVRFSLGGSEFRLATIAGMEVAKLVPWNSLLN